MSKRTTAQEALAFVREQGVVLVSAKGAAPRLTEAIIDEPINGRITLVHRRLWPSLVRLANRFAPEQLAQVRQKHTPTGRHVNREVPFPQWVPPDIAEQATTIGEKEALVAFGAWLLPSNPAGKLVRPQP